MMKPTLPKPPDERISADSWAQTPPDVQTVVQALAEEVNRLREQSKRSSRNSSQPPSKDSVAAKAQQAKAREERRSGRQRGGQRGIQGRRASCCPSNRWMKSWSANQVFV